MNAISVYLNRQRGEGSLSGSTCWKPFLVASAQAMKFRRFTKQKLTTQRSKQKMHVQSLCMFLYCCSKVFSHFEVFFITGLPFWHMAPSLNFLNMCFHFPLFCYSKSSLLSSPLSMLQPYLERVLIN